MSLDRNNEAIALENYKEEKLMSENKTLVVTNTGLWVSPDNPFLGSLPRWICLSLLRAYFIWLCWGKMHIQAQIHHPRWSMFWSILLLWLVMRNGTEQLPWKRAILTTTVVSQKRAHGRCTLLCAQTGGWADICNIAAFYHKKAHVYIIYNRILHTNTPASTSLIQFSVCISQACVASHKWTSGSVPTFQEKDSKFHAMNFTGKPSRVEKLSRSFQKLPQWL